MTTVNGTIIRGDESPAKGATVKFTLQGADRAFRTDTAGTVVKTTFVASPDATGLYTVNLIGNDALSPLGTKWRREITGPGITTVTDDIIVPNTGGPFEEDQLLAEPVDPIPDPTPSNFIDGATLVASVTGLSVNPLAGATVTGTQVTVPDLSIPVVLRTKATLTHTVANSRIALAIVPAGAGVGSAIDIAWALNGGSAANEVTVSYESMLDPHSAGNYELLVYSAVDGTMAVVAGPAHQSYLRVFAA